MSTEYYVHHLSPFLIEFSHGFGVRWYGLAYVAGFLVGILLYKRLARQGYSDLKPEAVTDFIVGAAIFGVIVGGRLGYMLFYNREGFFANPLIIFKLWDGGMSSHGGMIGLLAYTLWYAHRHKHSWRNICDNLAVVGPLGLMFGRFANFINGELYGRAATVSWAMQFPKELYQPGREQETALQAATAINPDWNTVEKIEEATRSSEPLRHALGEILTPRHPSQLYEAFLEGAFLFILLYFLRTRFRFSNGVLSGVFFIAYAIVRIIGEVFREPDAPMTGVFTRGQFLSFFLVVLGIAFIASAKIWPAWPPKWKPASPTR